VEELTVSLTDGIGSIVFVQSLAIAQLGGELVEKAVKGYFIALESLERARLSAG
jgi:hypothetical protein